MKLRIVLSTLGLTAALCGAASVHAATASDGADHAVAKPHVASAPARHKALAARRHKAHRSIRQAAAAAASAAVLERRHASIAAARDAEQQRWIAQGLRSGRLTVTEAARLERGQAEMLAAQAALETRGHETVDEALQMQHRQDVQDWAIRTGHAA